MVIDEDEGQKKLMYYYDVLFEIFLSEILIFSAKSDSI